MGLASDQLGRHIGRATRLAATFAALSTFVDRQSKVGDMRVSLSIHQDVSRFEVAMDESLLMRVADCVGHFDQELSHLLWGKLIHFGPVCQTCAVDELLHDE